MEQKGVAAVLLVNLCQTELSLHPKLTQHKEQVIQQVIPLINMNNTSCSTLSLSIQPSITQLPVIM